MEVMFCEGTRDVFCMTVTPACSEGALGTWPFQGGPRTQRRGRGQTSVCGVYVCQCLSFAANLGRPTKESQGQNRNGEIPPSGIVGGLAETL